MRRATAVIARGAWAGQTEATVALDYEARYRRRATLDCVEGGSILLDLPEATELRDGDALALEDGGRILVRAAPEALAEARAETPTALARLAWHIGNRHTPCQIEAERLLIQRDHVLEEMLRGLGAAVRPVEAPFQPEGGAYGQGRTHGHAHAHAADADPNAHIPSRREA